MDERITQAAIAGLLHDIGKLEQRARPDPWKPPEGIPQEGQPVHAAWSQYFCAYHVPAQYRPAALAGAYHHNPDESPAADKSLSRLVALADKLSAGEREDAVNPKQDLPRQMLTIFDRISLGDAPLPKAGHYLPLRPLKLDRAAIFPGEPLGGQAASAAYAGLVEAVRQEAKRDLADPQAYIENLLAALQQYTWSVPSAYYHSIPDVSLFDHNRMTAALAVCLAGLPESEIIRILGAVQDQFTQRSTPAAKSALDQPAALLVGGDISGVQDFIYTISSKRAAKTLRGRSFYLQMLTEAALRFVLNRLGLPMTNVIYSGGGHFFLLAPVECQGQLDSIRGELTRIILRHHGTSLYLALDSAEVPFHGFQLGEFPRYWGEMHAALARRKQHRYIELGEDMHGLVFAPAEFGGNPDSTCSVCGADHLGVEKFSEREEQGHICSLCRSFSEEIGAALPKADFLALGWFTGVSAEPGSARNCLREFGMTFQFLKHAGDPIDLPEAARFTVWALGDPPGQRWPAASKPDARTLRYTVNRVPELTFDELQTENSGGFDRLGVLRMDVDNLGQIFKEGFGRQNASSSRATLARLASLSFQMSLYFEGWVKRLCEEGDLGKRIYAVYAGGDDVFLIGPWDRMPDLAKQIRQDFAQYTAGHPNLNLSAGMAFIDGKYPVYQAADDAAGALHSAKSLPGKNAFSFLGCSWKWQDFLKLAERKDRLVKLVAGDAGGEAGPKAILMLLRDLADAQAERARAGGGQVVYGPWIWRGMYRMYRMAERLGKPAPEAALALKQIMQELHDNHYSEIFEWGKAARWAQLFTREKTNGK